MICIVLKLNMAPASRFYGLQTLADTIATSAILSEDFAPPCTIGILAPWGSGKSYVLDAIGKHC